MSVFRVLSLAGGVLVLGCGWARAQGSVDPPLRLEPPLNAAPGETTPGPVETPRPVPIPPTPNVPQSRARTETPTSLAPPRSDVPGRVSQEPPPALAEGPKGDPPTPASRWTEGYWDWDGSRRQYVWVAGSWRVAPSGKIWVAGSWQRDDRGWYRVPGSWGDRREASVDWRRSGPPADRPAEAIGPAPRPGTFYVPGTHVPAGDRVVWRPGFWTAAQPGWEWIPARWVRLSDGWSYREGYWDRLNARRGVAPFGPGNPRPAAADRYVVARPAPDSSARQDPGAPTDLQPITDDELTRARADTVVPGSGPTADERRPEAGSDPEPIDPVATPDPRATVPAPLVIRPGLPIPYWDGRRLVVPPTRYGPGVVVDTPGPLGRNASPYPTVGVLPPRGSSRGFLPDGRPIPPGGPRGGVLGGRMRGFLDRVLP